MSQFPNKLGATTTPQVDEYGNPILHGILKTGHVTGGKHDSAATGVGDGTGAGTFDTCPDVHQQPHITGGHGTGAGTDHITGGHGTGAGTGHITGGHGTGAGTGHITGGHGTGAGTGAGIFGTGHAGHQEPRHGTGAGTDHITGGHGNGAGTGHITGGHGTGAGTGAGIFGTGHAGHQEPHTLRRSGSSSSEDDGKGGRRKKGLTQKIKEKLPCGHHEQGGHAQTHGNPTTATNTAPGGVYHQTGHQEKKGMMDKIKEKLPGHGNTAP